MRCWSCCRLRGLATSACSATNRLRSPRSICEAARQSSVELCRAGGSDARDRRQRDNGAGRAEKAGASNVRIVCIVAAPEGIALVEKSHPDVEIYTPVVDRELNAQKYILPASGTSGTGCTGRCSGR